MALSFVLPAIAEEGPIKLGAIAPNTGALAAYGAAVSNGIRPAAGQALSLAFEVSLLWPLFKHVSPLCPNEHANPRRKPHGDVPTSASMRRRNQNNAPVCPIRRKPAQARDRLPSIQITEREACQQGSCPGGLIDPGANGAQESVRGTQTTGVSRFLGRNKGFVGTIRKNCQHLLAK